MSAPAWGAPGFVVTELAPGGDLVATSSDSRLAGVCWWYSGGAYIEYGLAGFDPSDVCNVWDYETGRATIPFTSAGLWQYLTDRYRDPVEVDTVRAMVRHG